MGCCDDGPRRNDDDDADVVVGLIEGGLTIAPGPVVAL